MMLLIKGFLLGALIAVLLSDVLIRAGWIPQGNPDPTNINAPKAAMAGGYIMFLTFIASMGTLVWYTAVPRKLSGALIGGIVALIAGYLSDRYNHSRRLLVIGIAISALAALHNGLLGEFYYLSNALSGMTTIIWIVVLGTTFALLDSKPHVSLSVGTTSALFLFLLFVLAWTPVALIAGTVVLGALVGILSYSLTIETIHLGDAGGLFLGYTLACLSLIGEYSNLGYLGIYSSVAPVLVFGIPLLDGAVVLWLRITEGVPIWKADSRPLSHRLEDLGLNKRTVVLVYVLLTALSGSLALFLVRVKGYGATLLVLQLLLIMGLILLLERIAAQKISDHLDKIESAESTINSLETELEKKDAEDNNPPSTYRKKYYRDHTRLRAKQRFNINLSKEEYNDLCEKVMNYQDPHEHLKTKFDDDIYEDVEIWRINMKGVWVTAKFIRSIHKIVTVYEDYKKKDSQPTLGDQVDFPDLDADNLN